MANPSTLSGNVRDQNEVPVIGALVYVYDETGGLALDAIETGEDGYWEAVVPDEGFYTVKYHYAGRTRLIEANVIAGRSPLEIVTEARDVAVTAGPHYTSIAAGEAATTTGQTFAVATGDGQATWYRRTGGGSTEIFALATAETVNGFIEDLAAPTGPALIGLGDITTLADALELDMTRFGLRPAASAAVNAAAFVDAIGEYGGGDHRLLLKIPPGAYESDDISVSVANIGIDGNGATLIGTKLATSPGAIGFALANLNFYHDTAQAVLTLNGDRSDYSNLTVEKFGAGDGYMAMVQGADDCTFNNIRWRGGNGIFIEGQRLLFVGIHGVGRTAGADDFMAIKARNQRTGDIQIIGCTAQNYADGIAFGGEIGTLQAASAGRVGRVENVYAQLLLNECSYGTFIKPGAIDAGTSYDWRDGLVRNVRLDLQINDANGAKLNRAVVVSGARNSLIEDVRIRLKGAGRFNADEGTPHWAHFYLPNSTGWTGGGAGGTIRDVEIELDGYDPYGGIDDTGSIGDPVYHGVAVEKETSGVGTFSDIRIRVKKLKGTKAAGVYVGANVTSGAVKLIEFDGEDLCNAPLATFGGVAVFSPIVMNASPYSIRMANTTYKPIHIGAGGDVMGKRKEMKLSSPAGTTDANYWRLPHDTWIRSIAGLSVSSVGTDGTNYITLAMRVISGLQFDGTAINGSPMGSLVTNATAIVADTALGLTALPTSGSLWEDRFLRAGSIIRINKTENGSGQPFRGTLWMDYVDLGGAE